MPESDERVAVLEANQKHLEEKLDKMAAKVDEMHALLLQAKGAKWALIGMASLGGFIAGKVGMIVPFLK